MTPEQRKYCMSRVRGRDTGPEIRLRKALWHAGFRYRLQWPVYGKPDIVFPGKKVAVFVDGCFWHACPLHATWPKQNGHFWENKIKKNVERDRKVNETLSAEGWQVLRFWEHEVNEDLQGVVERVLSALA